MVDGPWAEIERRISPQQYDALRPMSLSELCRLPSELIEVGAHTRTHCILSNESRQRRHAEIVGSVEDVRRWTGIARPLFAYPNGTLRDFDEQDKRVIAQICDAAVIGVPGANASPVDPFALHRFPISMNHDNAAFVAEITGAREFLKKLIQ